jgi:hypothetical protein
VRAPSRAWRVIDDAEAVAQASRGPGAWKVTRQIIAFAIASSAY